MLRKHCDYTCTDEETDAQKYQLLAPNCTIVSGENIYKTPTFNAWSIQCPL